MNKMRFMKPEEYLPRANKVFSHLKNRLVAELPHSEIEQIGSSAITGALSKGDLDVLVRVAKEHFNTALSTLQNLGFTIKQDTLRTDSLCMLLVHDYDIDTAIQLIEKGSKFEMFTVFRDRLNENSALVQQYNALKNASIDLPAEEYRQKKSRFIESVLGKQ
jgi:GrpB-like predicted nucleotidyltransferase (UPF0157 family)